MKQQHRNIRISSGITFKKKTTNQNCGTTIGETSVQFIHGTLGNNWEVRTEYGNFSELEIGTNRQFPPKHSYSYTRQGSSDLGKTAHTEMTCTSLAQYK